MRKIVIPFIVSLTILCLSCSQTKESENFILNVDLKEPASQENIDRFLGKLKIRLMPLETTDVNLFDGESSKIRIIDDFIFIQDQLQSCIFRFDKQGNYINRIFHKGEGDKEYVSMLSVSYGNGYIYVVDWKKIQVYDYEGDYVRTYSMDPAILDGASLLVGSNKKIYLKKNYTNETQLCIMNMEGEVEGEFLPSKEVVRTFPIAKGNNYAIGECSLGVYLANPMDNNIYLANDTVSILAQLDFGPMNLPSDFFDGTTDVVFKKFWDYRGTPYNPTSHIVQIGNLVVSDDWISFVPESFDPVVVYCNRKTGECITNKNIPEPFLTFLGNYRGPNGYEKSTQEFYRLVNALELKELIENLSLENSDYELKYPFLKDIDVNLLNENMNDLVLFFEIHP